MNVYSFLCMLNINENSMNSIFDDDANLLTSFMTHASVSSLPTHAHKAFLLYFLLKGS